MVYQSTKKNWFVLKDSGHNYQAMMIYKKISSRHLAEITSESGLSQTKGGVLGIVFN